MLYILNNNSAVKYVDKVQWYELMSQMEIDSKKEYNATKLPRKQIRQAVGNFFDYGVCAGHSISREREDNGNSKPNIKGATFHPTVLSSFIALSDAVKENNPKWRPNQSYEDILPEEYIIKFANQINQSCVIPSDHVSKTSVEQQCDCHNDRSSMSSILPEVACVSKIVHNERYSVNGQQRKSIDNYCNRVSETADVFETISKVITDLPPSWIQICHELFRGEIKE